jgi:hypothetical protein
LDSALTGRTDARAAYAALEKSAGSWKIPLAVRQPMSDWDFTSAASAMDTATQIIKLRDEIQTSVSGSNLSGGTFQTQFEAARTQSDLDAVLKLGQDESEAAKVVASAQSLDNGGKNPLQVIGLIGGNPSGSLKTAIDDLDRAKPGDAKTAAQGAIDTINGSTLQGLIRLAILLVLVLVVVVVMFFLARRRKSAPPFAPVYAGYPGWAGYPGGPSGPGMTPTDDAPANQATGWVAPPTGPAPDASAGAPLGAPGWTASPAPDAALAPVAETPPAPPAAAPDAAGPADGTSTDDSGTVS